MQERIMFKSKLSTLVVAVALMSAPDAFAFEGRYVSGSKLSTGFYPQSLTIKKRPGGRFDVDAEAGQPGCSSYLDTVSGVATGDTLTAEGVQDGQKCTLTLRRTKKGVNVEEGEGCSYFHGAACEFSGAYRKAR
jgi:hypothetical protein